MGIWLTACGAPQAELYRAVMSVYVDEDAYEFVSVNYSPNGTLLSVDSDAVGQVWDEDTGQNVRTFPLAPAWVFGASYSPDGSRILAPNGKELLVWDASTLEARLWLRGHTRDIYTASYSPDGTHILTASKDATVRVWSTADGAEVMQIPIPACDMPCQLAAFYNVDGSLIGTASGDNHARVWDASTGEPLADVDLAMPVYSLAFSPSDSSLMAIGGTSDVSIWNMKKKRMSWTFQGNSGWVLRVAFSPDGEKVAAIGWWGGVWLLDARTGAVLHNFKDFKRVNSVAYSPDGQTIAVAGDHRLYVYAVNEP